VGGLLIAGAFISAFLAIYFIYLFVDTRLRLHAAGWTLFPTFKPLDVLDRHATDCPHYTRGPLYLCSVSSSSVPIVLSRYLRPCR
jgi:hypothetical protein